ncbi:MAG TPA: glycoside hydrolase family 38 C-terminal domain-containing protein [Thermoanaerobaculia bacterium]|jgi:alpha-mannosidase|nr:glycoside hydrolase family 38 C-terminal domain-containing protein [Thermoanaerobaculia bacterium]
MIRRVALLLMLACATLARAADPPDLTKQPTLYVVGYAHLDTQWRWEYPRTIGEFLPHTMHDNFALFEKYPHYIFNFSGANRYRLMREYYPADYATLQRWVREGHWFPAGSSMEESDVNSPSAESLIRQVLYGSAYFRHDLGRTSAEYMLPDCFGFPASLPSILHHMGILGFSTQKLTWGSSAPAGGPDSPEKTPVGTPFNVGVWEGPDGSSVLAAFNPGSYSADVRYDLSRSDTTPPNGTDWPKRVQRNGEVSGLFTDYHYYGTGDVGGAPREPSVQLVESIVSKNDGPLHVISATAEQMFLDIKPEQTARLPRYKGDLELTNHSAGSLTSEAYQKRWNHKNELLADAAERASVAAEWLGGRRYPRKRLNDAWALVMGGQFHDIAAGTATPKAYEYSWNDDVIAMNQFASVLTSAAESITSALDTRVRGTAIVVYNPLSIAREDVVEARLTIPTDEIVSVFGPDGKAVPSQHDGDNVVFVAKVPSVGFAVYDVRAAGVGGRESGVGEADALRVQLRPPTPDSRLPRATLENARYRISIDDGGDIASIIDKKTKREILAAPARLALQTEHPHDWPAWNMDWADQQKPPRAFVGGQTAMRIVEDGPARVAIEVTRGTEGSRFVQTIRLAAGDAGNRIEIDNAIDWKTEAAALKATFPLTASNTLATHNWEVGTIQRGNNDEKKFEVASHQWFDLSDANGGVTILSDCKYGSDKPDDHTLRLTLLYTPGLGDGNGRAYDDQTTQDWGHHHFVYGLASHAGDWRSEGTDWQALRLSQPLIAFVAPKHTGSLGRTFSLLRVSNSRVRVLALKKAEESNEVIVRLVEVDGKRENDVRLAFAAPVVAAREVDGQEREPQTRALRHPTPNSRPPRNAHIVDGRLVTSFTPYQLRTFAVRLAPPTSKVHMPRSQPVSLPYDRVVSSRDGAKSSPGFDAAGRALPEEMLPRDLDYAGIRFHLADGPNAVVAHGQSIALPRGAAKRLYLLAAADGDQKAAFAIDGKSANMTIQDWSGYVGQWDNRIWAKKKETLPPRSDAPPNAPPRERMATVFDGLTPGFIKRAPIAWYASHRHDSAGANEPYAYSYLFAYTIDLPPGARTLTLPENDKIRVLAATVSDERAGLIEAQPLYDTLERR